MNSESSCDNALEFHDVVAHDPEPKDVNRVSLSSVIPMVSQNLLTSSCRNQQLQLWPDLNSSKYPSLNGDGTRCHFAMLSASWRESRFLHPKFRFLRFSTCKEYNYRRAV